MYCFVTNKVSGSDVKILIQRFGVSAKARPITAESNPAVVAPTMPILSARSIFLAPIFVPTMAVIAVPMPNTIGINKNSTLEPIP